MELKSWIAPVCFVLALCLALGGQARAADLSGPGDPDDITFDSGDDGVVALQQELTLEPPRTSLRVAPPVPAPGHGRRVVAELFRPPISVASAVRAA